MTIPHYLREYFRIPIGLDAFRMGEDSKSPTDFRQSFALIDPAGRLVDWDQGFVAEFHAVAETIRSGVDFGALVNQGLDTPSAEQFRHRNISAKMTRRDPDWVIRVDRPRTGEYRTTANRLIKVEERPTSCGGVLRTARDITDEREAQERLAEAKQQLVVTDPNSPGAFLEFLLKPDGECVIPHIDDALARLCGISQQSTLGDPISARTYIV